MCQIAKCGGGGNERTSASMRTLKTAMLWDEGGTLIGILLIDLPGASSFSSVDGTEDVEEV